VLADGAVVGRIMRANAAPVDAPWLWTVTFGHHEDRTPTHGYAVTREAAMTERVKAGRRRFVYRPCRKRTSHECLSDNQRLAKAVGLLRCRGKVPESPKPDQPTPISSPTFAANLRRLFLARDWSPYAVCQRHRKFGPSDRGYL
jgi:hypothetical protein